MNIENKELTFLDHVEVLRWHLIRMVSAILLFTTIAFLNKSFIFDSIILAPKNSDFITYKVLCKLSNLLHLGDTLCMIEMPFTLINMTMSGQFTTHIVVSFISGLIISAPYLLWEVWSFVKPGLHQKEIKTTRGIVFFTSILFLIGVAFGYFLISPMSVNFLGTYTVSADVKNTIDLSSYISTVTTITLWTGVVFELPILVYFLSLLGILTPDLMRNYRKHALVGMLIIAAIITPPDVASQVLVSIPMYFLYELSIFVSKQVVKKNNLVD